MGGRPSGALQVEQHPLWAPCPGSLTRFYQWGSASQRIWSQRRSQRGMERRKEPERKDGEIQGQGKGEGPGETPGTHLLQGSSPLCP